MNKTEHNKKAVLKALEKSLGVITIACMNADVGRTQFYQWLKDDPKFAEAVKDVENITLDFAESELHKQIRNGSSRGTTYLLNCKGGNRGWGEKSQLDITSDNKPIVLNIGNGVKPNK